MSKHSPGPWQQNTTFPHKVVGPHNKHIATAGFGPSDQTRIDARLIAAAPDMLAALEASPMLQCHHDHHNSACWPCMARAAIARAKGVTDMTDTTFTADLGVHLHRWDAEFRVWDLEATFRLHHRAQTAAKALSATRPQDVYRIDDTRGYVTLVKYVANGTVSDEDPRYTDTTISNEE